MLRRMQCTPGNRWWAVVAVLLLAAGRASATTLTFGELPFQSVNGLSFQGLHFSFGGNAPSFDAYYNSGGPGTVIYLSDPVLEGNAAGTLTIDFLNATSFLQFGIALNNFDALNPGFTVELYDSSLAKFATVPVQTSPLALFTEGQFTHSGTPVKRAVITFNPLGIRFALDNLSYNEVPPCVSMISPTSQTFSATGGSGTINVTAPGNCSWSANSNANFISITGGASGAGNGTVSYAVAPFTGTNARTGNISIGGFNFTVIQSSTGGQTGPTPSRSRLEFAGTPGSAAQTSAVDITTDVPAGFTATAVELNGPDWLSVSPAGGSTVSAGFVSQSVSGSALASARLSVTVNFAVLTAGFYEGDVLISAGGATSKVHVLVSVNAPQGRLLLSPDSIVFVASEGGLPPRSQTLRIANLGPVGMGWAVSGGEPAAGAANSPQQVAVTLHVVPAGTAPKMELSPRAMVFVAQVGGGQVAPQTLTVSNLGAGGIFFTVAASTSSGGNWLGISAGSGSTSLGPAPVEITVNAVGLGAGVYRGKVAITPQVGGPQEVEVVLVVAPAGSFLQREQPGAGACAGTSLEVIATTIGNGVSQPVSFPRPVLAQVVDNCGAAVEGATVVATLGGLSLPLPGVGGGLYSGSWTPTAEAAAVPVTISAAHPSLGSAQRSYTVSTAAAAGGVSLPVLSANGVVEGAGFTALRPLAPGSIVSLFGTGFSSGTAAAGAIPLPRTLGNVRVRMGGQEAPLYFVGPTQINAQVPFTARVGEQLSIVVSAQGRLTAPQNYLIAPGQPGVFQSGGVAAVLDAQFRAVNAGNPARIGETVQIFANGLGVVDQAVGTGEASPGFSTVQTPVAVELGGVPVPVVYQGLAPGFVGLYQVNVVLPPGVPTGPAVPLVIRQNGIVSNPNLPVSIPIQ
ncbi:MAG TPA: hypothetical protein VNN17_11780 [Terriglobia bacterium]|nr:hypothetical protein [Terriglobia bacterium]